MTALRSTFERQREVSLREKFDRAEDARRFFFEHDALHNLEEDLVFSILGRYHCASGCKVCFLDKEWLDETTLRPFIPSAEEVGPAYERAVLSVFDHFSQVACIDDLKFLKRHPHLFDFYRRNAERMDFYTTDNGFYANYPILMDELRFAGVGQLSFSDVFLSARDGKNAVDVVEKLGRLHARSPVQRVNFIVTRENPERNPHVRLVADWIAANAPRVSVYFHNDVRAGQDFCANLRGEGYREPSCYQMIDDGGTIVNCSVLTETLHLRYRSFFPDLYESMKPAARPLHELGDEFRAEALLPAVLAAKAELYGRHARLMEARAATTPALDTRLRTYFQDVGAGLRIHQNYNFIPIVMLSPKSKMYRELSERGFTNTHAGLIREGARQVVPIASMAVAHG